MKLEITIKNYRCFSDEKPVKLVLDNGFVALVGVNNSGKSSLLRFFYEFRLLFTNLTNVNYLIMILQGQAGISFSGVVDQAEVFCNSNDRDMSVEVCLYPDNN